ncbi:TetR/AcrR family transcriptional regulator [Promicromonospora sp. NPDC057488]|uniref:TetR/AcrR family transcriptional regulator n=1 Tax=Promicromonospora sp. NPDC057488 TaxID=3346147 RepID=UPI00367025FA
MPKRVDPEARRQQVADAVIDEIVEHGLRAVTLARISARTGLAIGSIRHFFGDNIREVMRFTLGVLTQRLTRSALPRSDDPLDRIADVLMFAAPTSEQELREHTAFIEYRVLARTDPEFAADIAATSVTGAEAVRTLLRDALTGRTVDEETFERETLQLFTLIEGFSFSAAQRAAPLREADVRAIATATVDRLRAAHPLT